MRPNLSHKPVVATKRKAALDDLQEKRKTFYIPANCILTIHTSSAEADVLKTIESCFSQPWGYANNVIIDRINAQNSIPGRATIRAKHLEFTKAKARTNERSL